jgi:hypothetical protein
MNESTRFGDMLTEAIWQIKIRTSKPIEIIQDEMGYAIGKRGGASIERWRQGYPPAKLSDLEALAQNLAGQVNFAQAWFEEFLRCGQHPYPEQFCRQLSSTKEVGPLATIIHLKPRVDVRRGKTDRLISAEFAMPLYHDDVVYTYAQATAHIIYNNGLVINLPEESNLTISPRSKANDKRVIGHWNTEAVRLDAVKFLSPDTM